MVNCAVRRIRAREKFCMQIRGIEHCLTFKFLRVFLSNFVHLIRESFNQVLKRAFFFCNGQNLEAYLINFP